MAIPIGDDNSDRHTTPFINYLLIAINIFVFIYWQRWGYNNSFTYAYVTVPAEILSGHDITTPTELLKDPYTGQAFEMPGLQITSVPIFLTLFTSMFLHGGLAHLLGNMLYLWIFGDNIEHALGHIRYLIFYLLCGSLAGLAHVITTMFMGQNLLIPCLGASGAISAVLGAYILLYPRKRIRVLFFIFVVGVPAFVVVGLWFAMQVLNGIGMLGGEEAGGVAYAAHIGGFIAGLLLVRRFMKKIPLPKKKSFWKR